MAITKLNVNEISLSISTNLVTPAYKKVVCAEDHSLEGSKNVNKRKTRCGPIVSADAPEYTLTNSGAANLTPDGTTEISLQELHTIFQSGSDILVKLEHTTPANYYRQGLGSLTKFTETGKEGDVVGFDFTIEFTGLVDITV